MVALRKESVDRNTNFRPESLFDLPSLSARRAWIEIGRLLQCCFVILVALRKESVDRNLAFEMSGQEVFRSLSARRAWIEIVDYVIDYATDASRSPQGERG